MLPAPPPAFEAPGIPSPFLRAVGGPTHESAVAAVPESFGRLVALYQGNELLLSELRSVERKLRGAREHLESPGGGTGLARAYLLRLKARHTATLTLLRANRALSRDLLARLDAGEARVSRP